MRSGGAGAFAAFLSIACMLAACGETPRSTHTPVIVTADCRPAPDPTRAQYVVGYGSLMESHSRARTAPQAGPAHPVEVSGYRRGWMARAQTGGFGTTFLGAAPDPSATFNAVAYAVDEGELRATDQREASYCRARVPAANLRWLEPTFAPEAEAQAWIYVSLNARFMIPTPSFPIAQSYVDVFVGGCLEQEQRFALAGFARECIATTGNWSEHWVNDRIHPRRPFVFEPRAPQIDRLLSSELPDYFGRIRLEGGR